MQTVSAGFTAQAHSDTQLPVFYLEVSWSGTGSIAGARGATGWTNETSYLKSYSGQLRISPPGETLVAAGEIGVLELVMDNTTNRFSWLNTASPLTTYINTPVGLSGKPVRLWQGFTVSGSAEYVCIFTGIIDTFSPPSHEGTVTLNCRDWGFRYLQDKRSSAVSENVLPNEWTAEIAATSDIDYLTQDVGLYRIPYAWLDDESVVAEIWETWEADAGLAYFDQKGYLRCENALHWLSHAVVWGFSESQYVANEQDINVEPVLTKAIVEWAGRTEAPITTLYELDVPKIIPPNSDVEWTARYQQATARHVTPSSSDTDNDYYAQSYGGTNMTANATVTLSDTYAQRCTVSVHNDSPTNTMLLTKFRIRGYPLLGGPTEQAEAVADPKPFTYERTRSVRGNAYVQTPVQGQAMADLLALRNRRIRHVWQMRDVLGVPQLELTDRVSIVDANALGYGNDGEGFVIGIDFEGGAEKGFVQTIRVLDMTDLLAYDNYFIIGSSKLGSYARAYY